MKDISKEVSEATAKVPALRQSLARLLAVGISRIGALPKPLATVSKPFTILFEGTMLGLLGREDMDTMVSRTYRGKPKFYDPNRYRLPYEERILPEFLKQVGGRKKMLDAFCGQGREAEILTRAGFEVTGVDHLDWMIDGARKHMTQVGLNATFEVEDFLTMSTETRYDIVYTSLWMYSTHQGKDRRFQFLNKCRELSTDTGIIVLSCVDAASFSRSAAVLRFLIARVVGFLTLGNLKNELGERTYGGLFWHHLSGKTVRDEFAKCGLNLKQTIRGTGVEPTFYFLSLKPDRGDSCEV